MITEMNSPAKQTTSTVEWNQIFKNSLVSASIPQHDPGSLFILFLLKPQKYE